MISGSLRKQMAQQNQEFSIQNEDFPALPGFKGAFFQCTKLLQFVLSWMIKL